MSCVEGRIRPAFRIRSAADRGGKEKFPDDRLVSAVSDGDGARGPSKPNVHYEKF